MDDGTEIARLASLIRSGLPRHPRLTGAALVSTAGAAARGSAASGFDEHSDIDVVLLLDGEACLDPPPWLPDFKFVPSNGASHREFNVFPLCEHCESAATSPWPDEQLYAYEIGYQPLFEQGHRLTRLVEGRLRQFRSSADDRLATAYARGTIALRKQAPRCLARGDEVGADVVAVDGFRLLSTCSFLARGLVPPPAKWLYRRLAEVDEPAGDLLARSRRTGSSSDDFSALVEEWVRYLADTCAVDFASCYTRWITSSKRQLGPVTDGAGPAEAGAGRRVHSTRAIFGFSAVTGDGREGQPHLPEQRRGS